MPTRGDTQINNFVGGLITEASPLSFPENASLDEINFKLNRDGTRWRRLGLDFEDDYVLNDTGFTDEQMARSRQRFFRWPSPSGNVDIEIGVVQIGGALYFIDLFTENPSANLLNGGNAVDSGLRGNVVLDFTIINNDLIVVGAALPEPFFLSYDADTDTITNTTTTLKIRDFYGVDDGLSAGQRPTTLSNTHKYNLRNQGWSEEIISTCGTDALDCTFTTIGKYPSNSDTWSLGKVADVTDADHDKYDPEVLQRNSFDIGEAPKGRFIIDLYDRGASREIESGITLPSVDRELGLISVAEAYAGRIFYSGINSKILGGDNRSVNMSAAVLFSQTVRNKEDVAKCYQQADPTSPNNNDLVDTDGGIVFVSGAVNIVKLLTIKTSLFVFAENGVWEIRGDEGGFRPTAFQVNKVSSIGVFSPESIVEANGTIFFWAKEGIFSLSPNQFGDAYDSTNVTITTIQRHYNSLPNLIKQAAKGYYDVSNNSIRWLFQSDETKVVGEPIEIQPPIEPFLVGEPVSLEVGREPEVVRVNSTLAFIVYMDSTARYIYYQTATINTTTMAVTLGAQTLLVDTTLAGAANGYTVERLSDNRIVAVTTENFVTKARLITFSGSTPTVGSPTTVNSVFAPISQTSQLRSAPIDSERIVIKSRNITNGTGAIQIVKVVSSTISFGSVVNTSSQNHLNTKVCMLSTGTGIYADHIQNGTSFYTASFTVSDVTITLNTEDNLPDLADFPSGTTNRQVYFADIQADGSSRATWISSGLITDGSSTNEDCIITGTLTLDGTNEPISGDVVVNKTPTISETTMYLTSVNLNNRIWAVYMDEAASPRSMYLAEYRTGVSTEQTRVTLDTATLFERHPEIIDMTNNILFTVYRTQTPTDTIKGVATRIT